MGGTVEYALASGLENYEDMLSYWIERDHRRKIVLGAQGEKAIQGLAAAAESDRVPRYLVRDAGRTEVDPGTVTAIGMLVPDSYRATKNLSLYKDQSVSLVEKDLHRAHVFIRDLVKAGDEGRLGEIPQDLRDSARAYLKEGPCSST